MKQYNGWFEVETGLAKFVVIAESLESAVEMLKQLHPEDIGSDGEITDPDTSEDYPLDW